MATDAIHTYFTIFVTLILTIGFPSFLFYLNIFSFFLSFCISFYCIPFSSILQAKSNLNFCILHRLIIVQIENSITLLLFSFLYKHTYLMNTKHTYIGNKKCKRILLKIVKQCPKFCMFFQQSYYSDRSKP